MQKLKTTTFRRALSYAESVVARAGVVDPAVETSLLNAFASVPRHTFLSRQFHSRAYEDVSLPIGYKQVSSQPSLLARMLGLIGVSPGMRILQLGIGSGYSAALMASIGVQVYGLESVGLLAQETRRRLDQLGFQNVLIRRRSGHDGWLEHAPYDAIIVSFAVEEIPNALLKQLVCPGGALVAALGSRSSQQLCLVERRSDGPVWYQLEGCRIE